MPSIINEMTYSVEKSDILTNFVECTVKVWLFCLQHIVQLSHFIVIYVLKFSCRSIVMCFFFLVMISKRLEKEWFIETNCHSAKVECETVIKAVQLNARAIKNFLSERVALFNIYFMDNRLGSFHALNG